MCRGGGVQIGSKISETSDARSQEDIELEKSLYRPTQEILAAEWQKDKGFDVYLSEITAHQGRKTTVGKWTRPDITAISQTIYRYVPGRHFDVITFEIKKKTDFDVIGVHEAAAHQRFSTQSYGVYVGVDDQSEGIKSDLDSVLEECKRLGVGIIIISDINDQKSWTELLSPERKNPSPSKIQDFIAKQCPEGMRDKIERLHR